MKNALFELTDHKGRLLLNYTTFRILYLCHFIITKTIQLIYWPRSSNICVSTVETDCSWIFSHYNFTFLFILLFFLFINHIIGLFIYFIYCTILWFNLSFVVDMFWSIFISFIKLHFIKCYLLKIACALSFDLKMSSAVIV